MLISFDNLKVAFQQWHFFQTKLKDYAAMTWAPEPCLLNHDEPLEDNILRAAAYLSAAVDMWWTENAWAHILAIQSADWAMRLVWIFVRISSLWSAILCMCKLTVLGVSKYVWIPVINLLSCRKKHCMTIYIKFNLCPMVLWHILLKHK
jgi:hypothetical protein